MKRIFLGTIILLNVLFANAQNPTSTNGANKESELKNLLKQVSLKALELDSSFYSDEQIKDKWIGKAGCSQEDIDSAERRLGISLPKEYKEFITITNGFNDANGVEPTFCPIQQINFLNKVDPELIEIWIKTGNVEVGDKMKKAIIVGGIGEDQQFLLIPMANGKWEFWKFASWIPGEEIYSSLNGYFNSVLTTIQLISTEK